jgi:hypothetical protein
MKARLTGPLGKVIRRHLELRRSLGHELRTAEIILDQFELGVATLERRSKRRDIGVSDPRRCGIASTHRSRQRDRQL